MFPEFISISIGIVGVTFGDRQNVLRHTNNGEELVLVPEPFNAFDKTAINVKNNRGESLGYIPKAFSHKDNLFRLLMEDEKFICCASHKRGGGQYSYGMDVTFAYYPFKDDEREVEVTKIHGKHPTNRIDLNKKYKYKDYYVLFNHRFDSKENRKYYKRKMRDAEYFGKSNLAKYKSRWKEPYIGKDEIKSLVLG